MDINYEIIEKYLVGELTATELSDFNTKLETDEEFRKEVELYTEINKSLANKYSNLEKENELKSTLNSLANKYFQNKENEKKTIPFKKYFLQFSSIAAILLIAFFLLKPQNLYNEFAEHSSLEIQVKGDNDKILLDASNLFNNKEYSKAIPLFQKYLDEKPSDIEIQMSLGISFLEENQIEKAINIFKNIEAKDNVFNNKAKWYLALAHLKNKENSKAKEYLNQIPKSSSYYNKAIELNSKLD